MKNSQHVRRAQTNFLRAFKTEPFGPSALHWPSPAVLRRWLRRPGFLKAMKTIREAMRYQADFQLLSAASAASQVLHTLIAAGDSEVPKTQIQALSDLLKLAHLRERFAPPEPKAMPRDAQLMSLLRSAHPNATVADVLSYLNPSDDADDSQ
jgi:hypothetical protein